MRLIDADKLQKEIHKLFPIKQTYDYVESDLRARFHKMRYIVDEQPTATYKFEYCPYCGAEIGEKEETREKYNDWGEVLTHVEIDLSPREVKLIFKLLNEPITYKERGIENGIHSLLCLLELTNTMKEREKHNETN